MVGEVSAVPAQAALPSGVRLVPVTDPAGVGLLIEVHERVLAPVTPGCTGRCWLSCATARR